VQGRKQKVEVSDKAPEPGHCEPDQRGRLKCKAKAECGLIGSDRVMSVLRRPLLDHEPNAVLHRDAHPKCRRFRAPLARAANSLGK
jgi:hypothetical protein